MGCKNAKRSDIFGEIDEFADLVENTFKPLAYLSENAVTLKVVIDMAAAVGGGISQLSLSGCRSVRDSGRASAGAPIGIDLLGNRFDPAFLRGV